MEIVTVQVRLTTPEQIERWNKARVALRGGTPQRPKYLTSAALARDLLDRGIDEVLRGQEAVNGPAE